jgi:soluble lytic murein transglycosylase-like protein
MRGTIRLTVALALVLVAAPARADVLVLRNGRTLSVRSHTAEGDLLVVSLRGGGIATFARDLVERIEVEAFPEDGEDVPSASAREVAERLEPDTVPVPPAAFATLIAEVAGRHGVDPRLVHAVVQAESNYQPRARSAKGARGLMQVLPSTGAALGVRNLYDPSTNLEAGVQYLKGLLAEFPLPQALAAYNAGPAVVRRYRGIPPYRETQRFVDRVLRGAGHVKTTRGAAR